MRIAITGGIAEGKSTVLNWLAEDGFRVASSDDAARELFRDPDHNRRLANIAGLEPPLAPRTLMESMLNDIQVRRTVNRYMHPLIAATNAAGNAQFFEVPLLLEACLQLHYDEVWVVSCGEVEQRRRLMERHRDERLVSRLLAVQLPTYVKTLFSDVVLRTNRPPESVRKALKEQAMRVLS